MLESFMRILILGCGYTGSFLQKRLLERGDAVFLTHRNSEIKFDLEDLQTWRNLPTVDQTYWLFPPQPAEKVRAFLAQMGECLGEIVVVGTTSAYSVTVPAQMINEKSKIIENDERTLGEALLWNFGAKIIRSSGIYGPGRDPRRWLESGRIRFGKSYLNVIHVEDLASCLLAGINVKRDDHPWIASDSHPKRWVDLKQEWYPNLHLDHFDPQSEKIDSKKIDCSYSLTKLGIQLKFPNVLFGVQSL